MSPSTYNTLISSNTKITYHRLPNVALAILYPINMQLVSIRNRYRACASLNRTLGATQVHMAAGTHIQPLRPPHDIPRHDGILPLRMDSLLQVRIL